MDDDQREVLAQLERFARGDAADDNRDQVTAGRVGSGAMRDGFELTACPDGERTKIVVGDGELAFAFTYKHTFMFACGDLAITTDDRERGAALVDELARWLGVPLDPQPMDDIAVTGEYVQLGAHRDADGATWELYKLFLFGGARHAEVFFRLRGDRGAAAFAEKWSRYRCSLVELLDAAVGHQRRRAPHKRLVIDGGAVAVALPREWTVSPRDGHLAIIDPTDECLLELSYMPMPIPRAEVSAARRLEIVLKQAGEAAEITSASRPYLDVAWADYPYEASDPHRDGARRPARGRWLIAANDQLQAFATFYYWVDDAEWAVAAWQRIVDTLRVRTAPGRDGIMATHELVDPDAVGTDLRPDLSS